MLLSSPCSNWQGNWDYFHRFLSFGIEILFGLDRNDNALTKSRRSRDTWENADCYRGWYAMFRIDFHLLKIGSASKGHRLSNGPSFHGGLRNRTRDTADLRRCRLLHEHEWWQHQLPALPKACACGAPWKAHSHREPSYNSRLLCSRAACGI